MTTKQKIVVRAAAAFLFLGGCGRNEPGAAAGRPAGAPRTYAVRGVVEEVKPAEGTVVVAHEAIPGYMEAMTMPFKARNSNDLSSLAAGDAIAFRLVVTAQDGWIENIEVRARTNSAPPKERDLFRRVREVEPLKEGDEIPNYSFTNELGRLVHLRDFQGQAVGLTFLFTRCPFPTFCPRMTGNFLAASRELSAQPDLAGKWHLLTLSFDPDFDTPATLKRYAEKQGYDPARWSFLTGALEEIDAITEQFGLYFSRDRPNGITFNHNLRTVVLGPDGRVKKVFSGNEWAVKELVSEMKDAALKAPTPPAR